MAVAHGTDKRLLLDHKAAIDQHLSASDIDALTMYLISLQSLRVRRLGPVRKGGAFTG